ncbi:uncharacterized protein IL334_004263 [Kwoniella shivajii]|uniref:Magnesium transporter n=1 Tax=Kwoniella shivajii TaxID=564305 RepID=A0ABZ1D1L0_9TREE|nr:hypothetical protein IL334_004263 [Kwoniella shivajii]
MSRSAHLSKVISIAGPSRIRHFQSTLPPPRLIRSIFQVRCNSCQHQRQRRGLFTRRSTSFWTHSYPSSDIPQVPYTPPSPYQDHHNQDQQGHSNNEHQSNSDIGQRKDRKQRYLDSLMDKAGELSLRCSVLDSEGNWTAEEGKYKKTELCREHDLDPRDLRKLDSLSPNLVPIILTRKSCILISMLNIKALIKPDRVIVFDIAGTQESEIQKRFKYHLERNIRAGLGIHPLSPQSQSQSELQSEIQMKKEDDIDLDNSSSSINGNNNVSGEECEEEVLCYEHRALESILVASANALEEEMAFTRQLVRQLLTDLEDDINRDNLKRLLHYSRRIVGFQSRARYVKRAVDEILESDEDLSAMYLTSRALGRPRALHDHEQLELLLESFVKQVEEIVSEVDTTVANMNSTQEIAELMLDSGRNALLALDIKISIATLGIGTGALVAGLFGMNLTTQLESTPYAFIAVSGSASLIALLVMIYGSKTLRRVRRVALTDKRYSDYSNMMTSQRWDRSVDQYSKGFDPALIDRKSEIARKAIWEKLFWRKMIPPQSADFSAASASASRQAKLQARLDARGGSRGWHYNRMSESGTQDQWNPQMENGVWKWGKGYGHSKRWAKD